MVKRKRHELAAEAARRNREVLARLGAEVRESRLRRRMTQAQLGERISLARSTVGAIERGLGGGHTLDAWQRIGLALDRPLRIELSRDAREEPADAGHLAIQELVMRVGRGAGFQRTFELPTRPANPTHATDVGLRDDRGRRLILVECWKTIGTSALPCAPRTASGSRRKAWPRCWAALARGSKRRPRRAVRGGHRLGRARHPPEPRPRGALPELFASQIHRLEPSLDAGAHHRLSPAIGPWSGLVRCARHRACTPGDVADVTSACGRSPRGRA